MLDFGIKDIFDIVIVALLLFYIYRLMKESGSISIFYGVMAFVVVWIVASEILELRLIGSILDRFMAIGLIVLVILFQDQIRRFLIELGSHRRWRFLRKVLRHDEVENNESRARVRMPIVYSCMSMSKSKTGALIVIQRSMSLESYEKTGDIINADINARLIENIFFKNSPLHDGAMIIAGSRIVSAGCILPVSHDTSLSRSLGLRHRSALGIAQATDALAIVVSEETGNISVASRGQLTTKVSPAELENILSETFGNGK